MTTVRLGGTTTLVANFLDVPGGSAVDVHNLTVTITALSGGVVIGPTAVGIVHAGIGVYSYSWSPAAPLSSGDYLISWDSDEANATEVVTVLPASSGGLTDAPCTDWPVVSCSLFPANTAAVSGYAVQAAQEILWTRSGRQFGTCQVTLRPCRSDCWQRSWPSVLWQDWANVPQYPFPYLFAGNWYNLGCGGCPGNCSCTVLEQARLPEETVSVDLVLVDGAVLDPSAYVLYDNRTLLRVDGGRWPICNDLNKADTEVGTWSVTLTYGVDVPVIGKLAMGELAVQIAKACVADGSCLLPPNTQQVVRQGVTQTLLDPALLAEDGKIGLRNCDLFLGSYNPQNLRDRARAFDPDQLGPRRPT